MIKILKTVSKNLIFSFCNTRFIIWKALNSLKEVIVNMNYHYEKIKITSPEEFYEKIKEGYICSNISYECNREELFKYVEKQKDSVYKLYCLGCFYFEEIGVKRSNIKAKNRFIKAAELGYAPAQYQLAFMFWHGIGTYCDYDKEIDLYKKSSEQGYAPSLTELGGYYIFATNMSNVRQEGLKLLSLAMEANYGKAFYDFAMCLEIGLGVERDQYKAYEYYLKALEKGYEIAQLDAKR